MPELDHQHDAAPSTRHEATAFFLVALLWLPMMAIAVGALVLPPGIAFALVRRGVGEHHASWVAMGTVIAVVWLIGLVFAGRKLLHRGSREARSH